LRIWSFGITADAAHVWYLKNDVLFSIEKFELTRLKIPKKGEQFIRCLEAGRCGRRRTNHQSHFELFIR
jgi:hypothetical protein